MHVHPGPAISGPCSRTAPEIHDRSTAIGHSWFIRPERHRFQYDSTFLQHSPPRQISRRLFVGHVPTDKAPITCSCTFPRSRSTSSFRELVQASLTLFCERLSSLKRPPVNILTALLRSDQDHSFIPVHTHTFFRLFDSITLFLILSSTDKPSRLPHQRPL